MSFCVYCIFESVWLWWTVVWCCCCCWCCFERKRRKNGFELLHLHHTYKINTISLDLQWFACSKSKKKWQRSKTAAKGCRRNARNQSKLKSSNFQCKHIHKCGWTQTATTKMAERSSERVSERARCAMKNIFLSTVQNMGSCVQTMKSARHCNGSGNKTMPKIDYFIFNFFFACAVFIGHTNDQWRTNDRIQLNFFSPRFFFGQQSPFFLSQTQLFTFNNKQKK